MKLRGRFVVILPFALVLFAFVGVYSYYRDALYVTKYVQLHSNIETNKQFINITKTTYEHEKTYFEKHIQSAINPLHDSSGFRYEGIINRGGGDQNRAHQSGHRLPDGTKLIKTTSSPDTTITTRETTTSFVDETTTPASQMDTRLHDKEASVGRQGFTGDADGNVSNILGCERFVNNLANQNMTDSLISTLAQKCLKTTSPLTVGPELFKSLFTNEVFQNLQCGEPEVGPNDGPPLPVIALASFPGSGNTWARVLLDQLTGIYTGSSFSCAMSDHVLKGSLVCPFSKVFIIKTHTKGGAAGRCGVSHLDYDSAIYILRNPYNAVIANYNRVNAGKVDTVTRDMFQDKQWETQVYSSIENWTNHVRYWLSTFDHPVHILVYEDLVANTLWELYKLSKFLNRSVAFETLWCIQNRQLLGAAFKREKPDWLQAKNLYSDKLKDKVNRHILSLIPNVGTKHGLGDVFESYML